MNNREIEKRNDQFQKAADKLLAESNLIEILHDYGEVDITGSYRLGLMMNGDIDIHVFVDQLDRESVTVLVSQLIRETSFFCCMFYDWVNYDNPGLPTGYYVGLKARVPGFNEQWKIDIWLVKEIRNSAKEYMELVENNLTPEKKLTVLKLKEWRNENEPDLISIKIYDAVFRHNISSIGELKSYIDDKN